MSPTICSEKQSLKVDVLVEVIVFVSYFLRCSIPDRATFWYVSDTGLVRFRQGRSIVGLTCFEVVDLVDLVLQ